MNTTRIDNQFITDGIDFGGTTSGWNHDAILPGISGADGSTSLANAYRIGGADTYITIEMTAIGATWDAFEVLALTISAGVSMSAFDSGGAVLIDTIHYDPRDFVVVPLPGGGALALAGVIAIGTGIRRRR